MTRRTEIERAVADLAGDAGVPAEGSVDAREGVTAPFVTYEDTAPGEQLPAGLDAAEVVEDDGPGATFVVVERTEGGGGR